MQLGVEFDLISVVDLSIFLKINFSAFSDQTTVTSTHLDFLGPNVAAQGRSIPLPGRGIVLIPL